MIPIQCGSQIELTKLYLQLLDAALEEAAASTGPQPRADEPPIRDQALLKAQGARVHCLAAHWKVSSARKTGDPTRG